MASGSAADGSTPDGPHPSGPNPSDRSPSGPNPSGSNPSDRSLGRAAVEGSYAGPADQSGVDGRQLSLRRFAAECRGGQSRIWQWR